MSKFKVWKHDVSVAFYKKCFPLLPDEIICIFSYSLPLMKQINLFPSPGRECDNTPVKSALMKSKNNLSVFLATLDANSRIKAEKEGKENEDQNTTKISNGLENRKL